MSNNQWCPVGIGDHDWPPELDSDAKCANCGLEYGQWSQDDE